MACSAVDDRAGSAIPAEAPRAQASQAAEEPAASSSGEPTPGTGSSGAAAADCPATEMGGVSIDGCCRSSGRCGFWLADYNGCVEPAHLGLTESEQSCLYTGTDPTGEDSDKDKDKDKDKDSELL